MAMKHNFSILLLILIVAINKTYQYGTSKNGFSSSYSSSQASSHAASYSSSSSLSYGGDLHVDGTSAVPHSYSGLNNVQSIPFVPNKQTNSGTYGGKQQYNFNNQQSVSHAESAASSSSASYSGTYSGGGTKGCCKIPFPGPNGSIHDFKPASSVKPFNSFGSSSGAASGSYVWKNNKNFFPGRDGSINDYKDANTHSQSTHTKNVGGSGSYIFGGGKQTHNQGSTGSTIANQPAIQTPPNVPPSTNQPQPTKGFDNKLNEVTPTVNLPLYPPLGTYGNKEVEQSTLQSGGQTIEKVRQNGGCTDYGCPEDVIRPISNSGQYENSGANGGNYGTKTSGACSGPNCPEYTSRPNPESAPESTTQNFFSQFESVGTNYPADKYPSGVVTACSGPNCNNQKDTTTSRSTNTFYGPRPVIGLPSNPTSCKGLDCLNPSFGTLNQGKSGLPYNPTTDFDKTGSRPSATQCKGLECQDGPRPAINLTSTCKGLNCLTSGNSAPLGTIDEGYLGSPPKFVLNEPKIYNPTKDLDKTVESQRPTQPSIVTTPKSDRGQYKNDGGWYFDTNDKTNYFYDKDRSNNRQGSNVPASYGTQNKENFGTNEDDRRSSQAQASVASNLPEVTKSPVNTLVRNEDQFPTVEQQPSVSPTGTYSGSGSSNFGVQGQQNENVGGGDKVGDFRGYSCGEGCKKHGSGQSSGSYSGGATGLHSGRGNVKFTSGSFNSNSDSGPTFSFYELNPQTNTLKELYHSSNAGKFESGSRQASSVQGTNYGGYGHHHHHQSFGGPRGEISFIPSGFGSGSNSGDFNQVKGLLDTIINKGISFGNAGANLGYQNAQAAGSYAKANAYASAGSAASSSASAGSYASAGASAGFY